MNRERVLSVLGEEISGNLQAYINNMTNICIEIGDVINSQFHSSNYLKLNSICQKRIEVISSLLKDIKSIIDISEKTRTYTIDTGRDRDEVREYIIELFKILDEISCAFRDENDVLLQNYSESLRQTISEYN